MTDVACRCCAGRIDFTFAAASWRTQAWDEFQYGECSRCGSLTLLDSVSPAPFYEQYELHVDRQAVDSRERRLLGALAARCVLRSGRVPRSLGRLISRPYWIRWFAGTGISLDSMILDVGSGSGAVLLDLERHGFTNLRGLDPFIERDLDYGTAVRIRRQSVDQSLDQEADAVILKHVIEHVDDPIHMLCAVKDLLADDGVLVVDVPVAEGPAFERFRDSWVGMDPPVHRFVPTTAGMAHLFAEAGLEVVSSHGSTPPHMFTASEAIAQKRLPSEGSQRRVRQRFRTFPPTRFVLRSNPSGHSQMSFVLRKAVEPR